MEIRASAMKSDPETVEFEGFAVKSAGSAMENGDSAMKE